MIHNYDSWIIIIIFETFTHTAKSPIIPTNEIDTDPRSNEANIFSTLADDEAITNFAPAGGLNALSLVTELHSKCLDWKA